MHTIDTIVFDLGGVLIDWNPRHLYKEVFDDPNEMEKFLTEICDGQWNAQMDAGKPFQTGVDELSEKYPQYRKQIQLYADRWIDMIGGEIVGTSDLLNQIAKDRQFRLLALTNWSAETFPLVRHDYSFFELFEGIVVSGEEKLIKPDPAFYQILLDRYDVKAENALFIDDNRDNIEAAKRIGFKTIHFTNPESLGQELVNLKVLHGTTS